MKITLLTGRTFDIQAKLGFEIKIVKSPRAKRLTLRIDEKAHLPVLTVPRYCSGKKAFAFVDSHRDWIQNMLARLPKAKHFSNGEQISIFGEKYIILHNEKQRGALLKDGFLIIGGEPEFLHRRVCDFLKKLALLWTQKASVVNNELIRMQVR